MAIITQTVVPGMTAEQAGGMVAQLRDKLRAFPGFVAHASGPVEGGYQATEIWETREAHERWLREVIAPMMQQAGMGDVPPTQYWQADNTFTR